METNTIRQYIAYVRVSTDRQGQRGVSLSEQRADILRYAAQFGLSLSTWIEERESAACQGRPIFRQMMADLRCGHAAGVIMHKIDRGARNLQVWSMLGELADLGVEVHFAGDGVDLRSRSGRLAADIQAVIAADYIRNLREEAKKGIYGRLKQGFYPFRAPIGFKDQGAGRAKVVDPLSVVALSAELAVRLGDGEGAAAVRA